MTREKAKLLQAETKGVCVIGLHRMAVNLNLMMICLALYLLAYTPTAQKPT